MGLFDKIKKAATNVADAVVSEHTREGRVLDLDLAAPGDPPNIAALADAVEQTPSVANASIPEFGAATWSVERSWVSDGYAIVSALPSVDVGYDRVAFAFSCQGDHAFPVGWYVPDDDGWVLLDAAGPMPQQLAER